MMKNKNEEQVKDKCEDEECGCDDEEMDMEELTKSNNVILNGLIDLLIEKNVISEEELRKKLDEMCK